MSGLSVDAVGIASRLSDVDSDTEVSQHFLRLSPPTLSDVVR